MRSLSCSPIRLLTESTDRTFNVEKDRREEDTKKRGTPAAHKLKRQLALARRSAHLESQRSREDFHVLEGGAVLGSQFGMAKY
jgi:hypothetical protein